jgi:glycoprotein-N-acetylgalactosamine 3-beta-galactosyltransferase
MRLISPNYNAMKKHDDDQPNRTASSSNSAQSQQGHWKFQALLIIAGFCVMVHWLGQGKMSRIEADGMIESRDFIEWRNLRAGMVQPKLFFKAEKVEKVLLDAVEEQRKKDELKRQEIKEIMIDEVENEGKLDDIVDEHEDAKDSKDQDQNEMVVNEEEKQKTDSEDESPAQSDGKNQEQVVNNLELKDLLLRKDEYDNWGKIYSPNRILCAIPFVYPQHEHRMKRIEKTWGPRCDILVWTIPESTPKPNVTIGHVMTVKMKRSPDPKDRNIWEKTHLMWSKLEEKYIDKAEWFVKVDDDTYLFVDNLREYLKYYNPEVPHYMGHTLPFRWKRDNIVFNTGIAYVLSRNSLSRLAPVLRKMPLWTGGYRDRCVDRDAAGEDTSIGICLRSIGINPDNTLDEKYRQRFLPFSLGAHRSQKKVPDSWYWRYKPKKNEDRSNCCADFLIATHGYKGGDYDDKAFQVMEEHVKQIKSSNITQPIPPKPSLFLYDPEDLDFKIDQYLNSEFAHPKQEIFKGYDALETK